MQNLLVGQRLDDQRERLYFETARRLDPVMTEGQLVPPATFLRVRSTVHSPSPIAETSAGPSARSLPPERLVAFFPMVSRTNADVVKLLLRHARQLRPFPHPLTPDPNLACQARNEGRGRCNRERGALEASGKSDRRRTCVIGEPSHHGALHKVDALQRWLKDHFPRRIAVTRVTERSPFHVARAARSGLQGVQRQAREVAHEVIRNSCNPQRGRVDAWHIPRSGESKARARTTVRQAQNSRRSGSAAAVSSATDAEGPAGAAPLPSISIDR